MALRVKKSKYTAGFSSRSVTQVAWHGWRWSWALAASAASHSREFLGITSKTLRSSSELKPVITNEDGSHFARAVINICSNKKKSEIRKHAVCHGINRKPICAIYLGKIIEEQFIHVKILAL